MSEKNRQRPLEEMGIPPESVLPDEVLTPGDAKAVRFKLSTPGYHYGDVDAYKERVDEAFEAFVELLHERDQNIHQLDEEVSRKDTTILNLKNQTEVLSAQAGIEQANTEDEEMRVLLEANDRLKAQNQSLSAELAELQDWGAQAEQYVADLEQRLAAHDSATPGDETPVADAEKEPSDSIFADIENFVPEEEFTPTSPPPNVEEEEPAEEESAENSGGTRIDHHKVAQQFPGIRPEDLE